MKLATENHDLIEHLKLVQTNISRMARNSVQMKTWAVSIVTTTFILSGLADDPHWLISVGGCIPVIAFWTLDARYLRLERCYIMLYEEIATGGAVRRFELDYGRYDTNVGSVLSIAWTWSVYRFYGALLLVMLVLLSVLSGVFGSV